MTLKPARKVKTTVMPRSDLKLKKKQERELKQTMKVNVVVVKPSPSTSHDSATISSPQDSLLVNAPTDSSTDAEFDVINEWDQGSSAQNVDIQPMSGDLLLAQCNRNLGEQPIVQSVV